MSAENDLALAYHMGYDDALAKRKPDASKAQVLAPYDLAAENAKLRELALTIRAGFVTAVDEWKSWELRSCFHDGEKYREYEEQFAIIRQYYDEAMGELGIEVKP